VGEHAVSFVSPDFDAGTLDEPDWEKEAPTSLTPTNDNAFRPDDEEAYSIESPYAQLMNKISPHNEDIYHASASSTFQQISESPHFQHHSNVSNDSFVVTPTQSNRPGSINHHSSPSLITAASPALSLRPSWPFESTNEARLFHHYIIHVAPWVCGLENPAASVPHGLTQPQDRCLRQSMPLWERSAQTRGTLSSYRECHFCSVLAMYQPSLRQRRYRLTALCQSMFADSDSYSGRPPRAFGRKPPSCSHSLEDS
jgi:hypothetical protein